MRSEKKVKKLVLLNFHKWIKVFEKKVSERMLVKNMRSCNQVEEEICAEKRKNLSLVQERKRRSIRVYIRIAEKRICLTL